MTTPSTIQAEANIRAAWRVFLARAQGSYGPDQGNTHEVAVVAPALSVLVAEWLAGLPDEAADRWVALVREELEKARSEVS